MKSFNLSDWALAHRSLIWFLMIVSLLAGTASYLSMGREEDPDFTIRTMIVTAALPGATANETVTQVTDRIERKLQELDGLKETRSVTYPGQAIVYVDLGDDVGADDIESTWRNVRDMMSDIQGEFPEGFAGFGFNDDFGDVFGNIYAFTANGFTPRELKDRVEDVRDEVLQLEDAGRVDLIGTRQQVVYVEFSPRRLAALGLDLATVQATLASQNAILPSGTIQTEGERILVRPTGAFTSAEDLSEAPLRANGIFFTLSDVAEVKPAFVDPPTELIRYNGEEALGLMIGMREGANIVDFGEELDGLMGRVAAELPVGITVQKIVDQPHVVEESVGHFVRALVEAVLIVLAVSFVSLGMRAGFVVTLTIPLVLAMTFVVLDAMGVTLQRISLGALIIALGLLVDDAMIAVETMIARLELGDSLTKAASYAWTSIAFPMLSGTLVTVAGFIPIGFNSSAAGEYTISLFYVIAVSLLLSWVVAVLFAPILGTTFLPRQMAHHAAVAGRLRRAFRRLLRGAMRFKWITIGITVAVFAASVYGMRFVEQQFFPASDRTEVLVDVTLRQNASFDATDAEIGAFEDWLKAQEEVESWTAYIGRGAPRFILTLESPTPGPNMGQLVIVARNLEGRERLREKIQAYSTSRVGIEFYPKPVELGPPVGRPVQYRLSGRDYAALRDSARDLAAVLARDPRLHSISLDWNEPARVVRLVLDQNRLRQLGLTQTDVAQTLSGLFEGTSLTELRDGRTLIDVLARGEEEDRSSLEALRNLQLTNLQGKPIPLSSFASLEWSTEQPLIRQRNRLPTITVAAAIGTNDQPATIAAELEDDIAAFRGSLPRGSRLEIGGTAESSAEGQEPIAAVVPLMLLTMVTLVMVQVQSFRLTFVVLAVAPLGLIGVVAALLSSGAPLGFVAILGVLALAGILIRNSIILVQAIEDLRGEGRSRWDAVFEASDTRARPILLTAAAASLALIPISWQVFWGPMAYAMMGGIIAGTVITLLFAPALYCAVFRVRPPVPGEEPPGIAEHQAEAGAAEHPVA